MMADPEVERSRARFEAEDRRRQRKIRGQGSALLIVGILLDALNLFKIVGVARYNVVIMAVGPAMTLIGLVLAIFGQPIDRSTGQLATVGKFLLVGALVLGGVLSLIGFVALSG